MILPAYMDRLPNNDVLYHAIADYRTPSGVLLEGLGVTPDETIELSRSDLLAGRDRTMEAALAWIASQHKHPTED
jgi:carboxyl-terminal processing protease